MSALYTVLIYPLELLFEVIFAIAHRIVGNPGWAIIILSLAVNFLVLPLYNRADAVQKQEGELERSLAPGIARIKAAFKGDERMMMLQAFYRENHYSPWYVLKGSVSILLQIPFFMAAYNFLSNLSILQGTSFGPIRDLGAPDQMFAVAGVSINILPLLMTLINLISGYIYTRGLPLKSKVQLYAVAALFLILLYKSPSGLAFYWTLNNVFSLIKNALYRLKRPGFVFSVICAATGVFAAVYLNTVYYTPYPSRRMRLTVIAIALIIPFIISLIKRKNPNGKVLSSVIPEYSKNDRNIFIVCGAFMALFTGMMIPSSVVKISPSEFMDPMNLKTPVIYIVHAFLIAAGFFFVWGGVFFALAGRKVRSVMSRIWLIMVPSSLVTYLFFGTNLGDISVNFVYFSPFEFTVTEKIMNLGLIIISAVTVIILYHIKPRIIKDVVLAFAAVSLVMGVINMIPINKAYQDNKRIADMSAPRIPLSAEGRNVMVIMLDRAPAYFVPIVFEELPQLYDQFDGFTYYPNTLSFGNRTKFAAPALFGGYDYTPQAINNDTSKTLCQSQNEALSVMPLLFRDSGFEVTLLDPPNANYQNPSDLTIFDSPEYEGIEAYYAKFLSSEAYYVFDEYQERIWNRNFFCYSIFKISPLFVQATIYNEGQYNQPEVNDSYQDEVTIPQIGFSASSSGGVDRDGIAAYEALANLINITTVDENTGDTFMYYDNETTHDAMLYQAPQYEPVQYVDNIEYDAARQDRFSQSINGYYLDMNSYTTMRYYSCNAAAYLQLGAYFDYLREQGVWDNTRIIIVSDHGIALRDALMFGGQLIMNEMCIDSFNPLLMVKDFGSTGFTTDESFMTNADVPYLAVNGIVDDPVNPFTGNQITMNGVHDMPQFVLDSNDWLRAGAEDYRFAEDDWYTFNGTQIIDTDAWEFDGTR